MKALDLHIHTIPTVSDSSFKFSLDNLKKYVIENELDGIAITNHNCFDKKQYLEIEKELENITVLPGVEIDLEGGHILLVSDPNDLDNLDKRISEISRMINSKSDFVELKDFKKIFDNYNEYLLIPHYDKNPKMKKEILDELDDNIFCGEVKSQKKFIRCIKNEEDLTPVFFSDNRIYDNYCSYKFQKTYFQIDNIDLEQLKLCLKDKSKVFLSKKKKQDFFQVSEDGINLFFGLNVVLGERSSGKSYLLDRINNYCSDVKYIKQFELLEKDDQKAAEEFEKKLSKNHSTISDDYLKEFKSIVDEVSKIDMKSHEKSIENYLETLKKNAYEKDLEDSFSSTKMFSEFKFSVESTENLIKIISAVQLLLNNKSYENIIYEYIKKDQIEGLLIALINKYEEETENNIKKNWINLLIERVQKELKLETSKTMIDKFDFSKYLEDLDKINKFVKLVDIIKTKKTIYKKEINNFKIIATKRQFEGAMELKRISRSKNAFSDAFNKYDEPYEFLQELKKIEIPDSDYYKYFVKIDYEVLNQYDFQVSGGDRAEFNLLNEIEDANKYSMLLIDEPESSFDNIFLKDSVNKIIKKMSSKVPVVVVTHNNTIGASIEPDYLFYTKRIIEKDDIKYKLYYGDPTSKKLVSKDGDEIKNVDVLIDCLEAGNEAYEERKSKYELLKD